VRKLLRLPTPHHFQITFAITQLLCTLAARVLQLVRWVTFFAWPAFKPPHLFFHWLTHLSSGPKRSEKVCQISFTAEIQLIESDASAEHLASQTLPALLRGGVAPVYRANGITYSENGGPPSHPCLILEGQRIRDRPFTHRINLSLNVNRISGCASSTIYSKDLPPSELSLY
jgi:hypothetical protein